MWISHDSTGLQESLDLDHVFEAQRKAELPGTPQFPDKVCLTWVLQGGNHSPDSEWGLGAQATKGRQNRMLHLKASLAPRTSRVATFRNGMGRLEFWDLVNTRKRF